MIKSRLLSTLTAVTAHAALLRMALGNYKPWLRLVRFEMKKVKKIIMFQGQRRERRRLRHVPREPDPSSAGHRLHLLLDFGLQGVEENAA